MKKILIIEDDEIVAMVYRNKLTSEQYLVQVATDGEEGLKQVESFRPDLILLDLIIPKLSGVDLMKKLRANPQHEKLPILVFSNTYLSNVVKDAWKAGASKCLSKSSSTPKQVIEVIRSILNESPAAGTAPKPAPAPNSPAGDAVAKPANDLTEATNTFIANMPIIVMALRNALQTIFKNDDEVSRTKQLDVMSAHAHNLTAASTVGLTLVAQFADAFEALLKELRERPKNINSSTLRTLASSVDFLEMLAKRAKTVETTKSVPTRILVVDDDLLSRRAITHALDLAKLSSADVEDPLTALKLLEENSYDLVFLDADMPGMNGFELCAKLRSISIHRKTPVIFVTGLTDFEARTNSTMAGANDFIAKPFPFVELAVKALIYVLRGRLEANK